MEKSPEHISQAKFRSLTARQQHKLLAQLAERALEGRLEGFPSRYAEMTGWVELDLYVPPVWLDPREALMETVRFHRLFCGARPPLGEDAECLSWQPRFPVVVAMDQIRAPYNLGSILRLMDNLGFEALVHSTPHLSLQHAQLKKSARGCEAWIPVQLEPDLPAFLETQERPVIGLELSEDAIPLHDFLPSEAMVVVLGNEQYGLSRAVRARCQRLVKVPTFGHKHSMNVSHAFAVFGYHCLRFWDQRA